MHVLVVEDNEKLRSAIVDILETNIADIKVSGVPSGEEALRIIKDDTPLVVLMDINLPGENGLKLTGKIKSEYPQVKVVIHTNYDLPEYREAADDIGADHFLSKAETGPFELVDLISSGIQSGNGNHLGNNLD